MEKKSIWQKAERVMNWTTLVRMASYEADKHYIQNPEDLKYIDDITLLTRILKRAEKWQEYEACQRIQDRILEVIELKKLI